MGVPAFFRWLCMRNPSMLHNAYESSEEGGDAFDNPYVDNLYLDMNGLIHPCCHPENTSVPTPTTFADMCNNIFDYIDKLIKIVRPQRLLYMAIDGVAPRAKMNQQRSRRFRSAQEAIKSQQRKDELLQHWREQGIVDASLLQYINTHFDSNVITPGTEFMHNLAEAIELYVYNRLNTHAQWRGLKVIFSDANIPGEGEHKILEFIRLQRTLEDYDVNTKHCLYGADADLIMLGLSTHEPYFYIIRETIITEAEKQCSICGNNGHFFTDCPVARSEQQSSQVQHSTATLRRDLLVNFQYIKLYVLRQWLEMEMREAFDAQQQEKPATFDFNVERVIDDFVFLCFFVGNDFLPHIPTLSIRDGGIDALIFLYKETLSQVGGYLTDNGKLVTWRIEAFLRQVARVEESMAVEAKNRIKQQLRRDMQNKQRSNESTRGDKQEEAPKTLLEKFKQELKKKASEENTLPQDFTSLFGRENSQQDTRTYKETYYEEKFGVRQCDFPEFQIRIRTAYAEALAWNYAYYYRGCISWGWFYPFHYAPFASDLLDFHLIRTEFELGTPFKPYHQLLAVFPPHSAHAIPQCFHPLMMNEDSEIIDYYPTDFFVDLKGKKFAYLGEVILPFIEEKRLVTAVARYEHLLSEYEIYRNRLGDSRLYMLSEGGGGAALANIANEQLIPYKALQVGGFFSRFNNAIPLNAPMPAPRAQLNGLKLEGLARNAVLCVCYKNPLYAHHECSLKDGVELPEMQIDQHYMQKGDRRSYQGERTVRLIERCIGITRRNNRGQDDEGEITRYQQNNFVYQAHQLGNKLSTGYVPVTATQKNYQQQQYRGGVPEQRRDNQFFARSHEHQPVVHQPQQQNYQPRNMFEVLQQPPQLRAPQTQYHLPPPAQQSIYVPYNAQQGTNAYATHHPPPPQQHVHYPIQQQHTFFAQGDGNKNQRYRSNNDEEKQPGEELRKKRRFD